MLQLGREIALSSVRRPFRRDSWTIVKPFREILATKGRAKGSLAFRRVLLLRLVRCGESRVQFPNSGFQGISRGLFRESYHPRSILPIFLFVETRVKKSFDSIFEK